MPIFRVGIEGIAMYPLIKSTLDRVFATFILLLVGLPCMTLGLINSLIDRGPLFFNQTRIGRKGNQFMIYKIRTMRSGEITGFGAFLRRWSIDEIPQLWNVLRGEMSIVGPRPLLVEYRSYYNDRQKLRHEVLPGITGLSQVNGRNNLEWEKRFEMDVYYVEHQSFWLDLRILLKTFFQLIDLKSADHHSGKLPGFSKQNTT